MPSVVPLGTLNPSDTGEAEQPSLRQLEEKVLADFWKSLTPLKVLVDLSPLIKETFPDLGDPRHQWWMRDVVQILGKGYRPSIWGVLHEVSQKLARDQIYIGVDILGLQISDSIYAASSCFPLELVWSWHRTSMSLPLFEEKDYKTFQVDCVRIDKRNNGRGEAPWFNGPKRRIAYTQNWRTHLRKAMDRYAARGLPSIGKDVHGTWLDVNRLGDLVREPSAVQFPLCVDRRPNPVVDPRVEFLQDSPLYWCRRERDKDREKHSCFSSWDESLQQLSSQESLSTDPVWVAGQPVIIQHGGRWKQALSDALNAQGWASAPVVQDKNQRILPVNRQGTLEKNPRKNRFPLTVLAGCSCKEPCENESLVQETGKRGQPSSSAPARGSTDCVEVPGELSRIVLQKLLTNTQDSPLQ